MSNEEKDIMFRAYHANPDLLALELGILLEPCTDPEFAVLHNKAINIIRVMCSEVVPGTPGAVFKCKGKLAAALAQSVLSNAKVGTK